MGWGGVVLSVHWVQRGREALASMACRQSALGSAEPLEVLLLSAAEDGAGDREPVLLLHL